MLPLPPPFLPSLPPQALLDGDFPSSILLAALLPPEPDDDHSESYMLNVPRSKNVFRRIYILYFVFHFTHHFLFQTSTGKSMFCFVIIAITWPLIPWHCYDGGAGGWGGDIETGTRARWWCAVSSDDWRPETLTRWQHNTTESESVVMIVMIFQINCRDVWAADWWLLSACDAR